MTDIATKLRKIPPKPIRKYAATFSRGYEKNLVHQADLLYMPDDDGYKYILVIVDGGTRLIDAEPIKNRESKTITKAFKTIYKRKILSVPHNIQVDAGTEFAGETKKYFENNNMFLRVAKSGRKKQQGLVESRNKTIAEELFLRMSQEELITGEAATDWVDLLKRVIIKLNLRIGRVNKQLKKPIQKKVNKVIVWKFKLGDKVRLKKEFPTDDISGKPLTGKFRATDLRYDDTIRTILNIHFRDNKLPLYILSDINNPKKIEKVGYSEYELQPVTNDETYGNHKQIFLKKKPTVYIAENIVGKKKVKNQIYYEVQWRGYGNDTSWEPRSSFIKNIHHKDLIDDYEDT